MSNSHNYSVIGVGITLITVSNKVGHFRPPFSILITPLLLGPVVGCLRNYLYKSKFNYANGYGFALLLLNDLLIILFARGIPDDEGRMWIFQLTSYAFLISAIALVIYAFTKVDSKDKYVKNRAIVGNLVAAGMFIC